MMTAKERAMNMNLQLLNEVTAFIWAEADMLDHSEYREWLNLWNEKGFISFQLTRTSQTTKTT